MGKDFYLTTLNGAYNLMMKWDSIFQQNHTHSLIDIKASKCPKTNMEKNQCCFNMGMKIWLWESLEEASNSKSTAGEGEAQAK